MKLLIFPMSTKVLTFFLFFIFIIVAENKSINKVAITKGLE